MNPSPDAGEACLVGSIPVGSPLEGYIYGRAFFQTEEATVGADVEFAHAAGEVLVAREQGHGLGCGTGVGRVPGDKACKRRRHKRLALVGPPVFSQNPANPSDIGRRIVDVSRPAPAFHLDLTYVDAARSKGVSCTYHLDIAWQQRDACRVVVWQHRVAALALGSHIPQGRDGPSAVVPAFDAPGRNGRVVHSTSQDEVRLYIIFKIGQHISFPVKFPDKHGVVHHFIQNGKPVTGRGLGVGPIGPELSQHPRVVAAWHYLWGIRQTCFGVEGSAAAGCSAFLQFVEALVFGQGMGEGRGVVSDRGGRDVPQDSVVGIEVSRPDRGEYIVPFILC